jgi:predicted Fe-Mo cluster-binding NifX family protein
MKIALPVNSGFIEEYFKDSEYFSIYEIDENNNAIEEETIATVRGCGCTPEILEILFNIGVKTVLVNKITAKEIFELNHFGIDVISSFSGEVSDAVNEWKENSRK